MEVKETVATAAALKTAIERLQQRLHGGRSGVEDMKTVSPQFSYEKRCCALTEGSVFWPKLIKLNEYSANDNITIFRRNTKCEKSDVFRL